MQFGFSRRNAVRQSRYNSRRPAAKGRRLFFDSLEDRRLLSGGSLNASPAWAAAPAQGETGTQTTDAQLGGWKQSPQTVAMFSNGDSVVAWANQLADGNYNLMFQQYDINGNPIGSATTVASENNQPGVLVAVEQGASPAPTSRAYFVVVWSDQHATGTHKGTTTYANETHTQVFTTDGSSSATTSGAEATLTGSSSYTPISVAMDASGNADLLYTGSSGYAVERYSNLTAARGTVSVGSGGLSGTELAAIAVSPAGNFVVTWDGYITTTVVQKGKVVSSSTTYYIDDAQFTASGTSLGTQTVAASAANTSPAPTDWFYTPSVSMDAAGDFVIAWLDFQGNTNESFNARVFYANGTSTNVVRVVTDSGSLYVVALKGCA